MSAFLDKSALDVAVLSLVLSLVLPAYDRTIRTIRQAAGELRGTDLEVDGLLMILAGEVSALGEPLY